jgi:hypothetical protein
VIFNRRLFFDQNDIVKIRAYAKVELMIKDILSWFLRTSVVFACGAGLGAAVGLWVALHTGLPVREHVMLGAGTVTLILLIVYHFFGVFF